MPFLLRPAARQDLREIWRFSARRWSPKQADAYLRRIEAAFSLIQTFPAIAPERGEFTPPVRVHPVSSHVVLFRVAAERIEVIRIRHANEDWLSAP